MAKPRALTTASEMIGNTAVCVMTGDEMVKNKANAINLTGSKVVV